MTSCYPGYDALEDIAPSFRRETMEGDKGVRAQAPHPGVQFVTAASLAARAPPSRQFLAPGLIPERNVTLLSGNGGDGKSLVALMLAVAVVGETSWLGVSVAHGGAVYVSAEDDLDEVHRRLASICAAERLNLADLTVSIFCHWQANRR